MKLKILIVLFCFLGTAPAGRAWAETASVRAEAVAIPSTVRIGDEIRLFIVVEHPKTYALIPPTAKVDLAPFEIKKVTLGPLLPGQNRVREVYVFTLTVFQLGEFEIPPIPVRFKSASGEEGQVWTSRAKVRVVSVGKKPGDKNDIRPIKGPFSFNLSPVWSWAAGALAAVLAAALGFLVWRRRRRDQVDPESLKPPHERAILELGRLKQKNLLAAGREKEFYSELSDILRRYLERRYAIVALEETSNEILAELKQKGFDNSSLDPAKQVLQNSDLVKFAKFSPPRSLADELERRLAEFVDATKPEEPAKP